MSPSKRLKSETIVGSSVKFDESSGSYRYRTSFVNFLQGDTRVYDVSDAFLKKDVVFQVLSEVNRVITLGNPRSLSGNISGQGIQVAWVLNRFDRSFIKRVDDETMSRILKCLETNPDAFCLRGITYWNKYNDPVDIHIDGPALHEICKIMGQEPRELYKRAADILNAKIRGHRNKGDSVIAVSTISEDDIQAYTVLVREKILRAQKVNNREFLITTQVDDAEERLVRSLHELSRKFECPDLKITNDDCHEKDDRDDKEILIQEQLDACNIAMNNPVSYICGMPGVGKTSALCRILRESSGTVVLTPSHVSREVVHRRAVKNGIPLNTFSVEVLAFAIRHVAEWMPSRAGEGDQHEISQRSKDFMEKFKGEDGHLHVETLVIEEASMGDIFQISNVIREFCRIDSLKRVIFCGDTRQLQSVSKGRVLEDIIECGTIPGKVLEVNHRSGSALSENLRHILKSSLFHVTEDETFQIMEFPLVDCEVETDSYGRDRVVALGPIVNLFFDHVNRGLPVHVFGYTHVEVNKINVALKNAIFGLDSVMFPNGCRVRVKDPEIISPAHFHRNDFVEIVESKGPKNFVVKRWDSSVGASEGTQDLVEINVTGRLKDALDLGYASSIHAFQGSECPYVIVHAISNCAFFSRDALYTAISRGKSRATIVTTKEKSRNWKWIVHKRAQKRLSNLSKRL